MVGKLLMYVDDVLALGPTRIVERVLLQIKEQWSLSIKGILVRDNTQSEFAVDSLRFLGCTLELGQNNTVQLHQIEYIKERLQEQNREVSQGRVGLPESMEGNVGHAKDRSYPHYLTLPTFAFFGQGLKFNTTYHNLMDFHSF